MSAPADLPGGIAVHLVTGRGGGPPDGVLEADARDGAGCVVVLLHDAVLTHAETLARLRAAGAPGGAVGGVRVVALADDCRRRGLPVPAGAVDHGALVDLIAAARRVSSW